MSCRNCSHCKKLATKKEKEVPREEKINTLRKNAQYSRAIGVLWKKIAQDWEKQAEELAKPIN